MSSNNILRVGLNPNAGKDERMLHLLCYFQLLLAPHGLQLGFGIARGARSSTADIFGEVFFSLIPIEEQLPGKTFATLSFAAFGQSGREIMG